MKPMLEEAFGKPRQVLIPVLPAGPEEEAFFQEPDSPLVDRDMKDLPSFSKTQSISKNPSQDFVIFHKRLGGVFESKLAHLPQEMDETLLFLSRKPVVSRIEVGHEDPPIIFGEDLFGDLGSPGLGNPVVGKPFIDDRPEPMVGPAHLPAGFVHVKVWALANRFEDLMDFDPEPLTHPLEGLSQGSLGNLEMTKTLK